MAQMARIVCVPSDGLTKTQGTKVMVGDQELRGVYKLVLTAEVNDAWRAEIHCHAQPTDITALSWIHAPSLWQRLKVRFFGA